MKECTKPGGSSFLCVFLFCYNVSFGEKETCVGEEVEQELEVSVDQAVSEEIHSGEEKEHVDLQKEDAVSHIADCGMLAHCTIIIRCIL